MREPVEWDDLFDEADLEDEPAEDYDEGAMYCPYCGYSVCQCD